MCKQANVTFKTWCYSVHGYLFLFWLRVIRVAGNHHDVAGSEGQFAEFVDNTIMGLLIFDQFLHGRSKTLPHISIYFKYNSFSIFCGVISPENWQKTSKRQAMAHQWGKYMEYLLLIQKMCCMHCACLRLHMYHIYIREFILLMAHHRHIFTPVSRHPGVTYSHYVYNSLLYITDLRLTFNWVLSTQYRGTHNMKFLPSMLTVILNQYNVLSDPLTNMV